MDPASSSLQTLRPLGLGEVLDRAVNLSVRHFLPFSLIYLVFAVPMAVLQYFGSRDQMTAFARLSELLQAQANGGKTVQPEQISRIFAHTPALSPWTGVLLLVLFFVGPLATAALIHAVSTTYLGGRTSFGDAYRAAVRHWLPLIGVNLLYLLCGVVLYVIVVVLAVILILGLAAVTYAAHVVGIILAVLVALFFVFAALVFALIIGLALQVSYFTCVVEGAPFVTAFVAGLRRVFAGVGLKRSLLVALAYLAVVLAISFVTLTGQALLFGLLRSNLLGTVYSTLISIATAAFVTAFLGIFYFDIRVRNEGFDLQLSAGAAASSAAPATT